MRIPTLSRRAWLLVCIAVALPLLASPMIVPRVSRMWHRPAPVLLSYSGQGEHRGHVVLPLVAERVSPASFDEIDPADLETPSRFGEQGLDGLPSAPPPLEKLPAFSPLESPAQSVPDHGETESEETVAQPIDESVLAKLQEIRARLEDLGADYVLLEATEDTGRYRFHCRMLVDDQTSYTRQFEADSTDPLAAAQQVLREIEAWRTAARPATTLTR